jgi:hypothetical protein
MSHIDPTVMNSLLLAAITLMGGLNMYLRSKAEQRATSQQERIAQVADNTHTLVNNAMGAQLQLTATTAKALADVTHDPVHVAAAQVAQTALDEHLRKQAIMDNTPAMKAYQPGKS